ncbi:MAG: MmgE/PrpD family protein, partial [Kiloniellaceae bacterium]
MAASTTAPSVSETLAAWIEGLKATDIPEAARREAENTIIDTIGLTVAALDTDYGQAVRKA